MHDLYLQKKRNDIVNVRSLHMHRVGHIDEIIPDVLTKAGGERQLEWLIAIRW